MAGKTAILSVRVLGDAKSATKALDETGRKASRLGDTGKKAGNIFKTGVGVVAAGAATALGVALTKGFSRLTGIENAQAKMRGLGYDTKSVDAIMKNALDSVKGTAFSLDAAATTAANAVAAGIQPGKDLDRMLKTVANSAAAAGTDMGEMGSIFNKVATSGKAQNDVLNQVADRGIPIYQKLADQLGVTADQVFDLAKKGKISFADFEAAMASATGSVASELGGTTTGLIMNLNAALGRLGASLLEEALPHLRTGLKALIGLIDGLEPVLKPVADTIGKGLGVAIETVVGWLEQLDFSSLTGLGTSLGPALGQIGESFAQVGPQFKAFVSVLPQLGASAGQTAGAGLKILGAGLQFVANNIGIVTKALPILLTGFAAMKAAQLANSVAGRGSALGTMLHLSGNLALAASNRSLAQSYAALTASQTANTTATASNTVAKSGGIIASLRSVAGIIAHKTAQIASTVATKAAAAAQWLWNAALSANPIGIIIVAIAAFVGAIIWAWNNVDWFRNGIIAAWNWIKTASVAVWNGLKAFLGAVWQGIVFYFKNLNPVGFIITHWSQIKTATIAVWNAVKSFTVNLWNGVVGAITSKVSQITTRIAFAWNAAKTLTRNAWVAMKTAVTNHIVGIVTVVKSIPSRVRSALGNLGSMLVGSGRALIDGFIRGIRNSVGRVANAAKNVVQKARNFFPFSPAKEGPLSGSGYTTHSGRALVADFAKAMEGQARTVKRAASRVAAAGTLTADYDLSTVPRVPRLTPTARGAEPRSADRRPMTVNINFNGLTTDRLGVAREIKRVLREYEFVMTGGSQ